MREIRACRSGRPILSLAADVRDWGSARPRTAAATQPRWYLMSYSLPLLYLGEGRGVNVL
jgi:hypothetical protein